MPFSSWALNTFAILAVIQLLLPLAFLIQARFIEPKGIGEQ